MLYLLHQLPKQTLPEIHIYKFLNSSDKSMTKIHINLFFDGFCVGIKANSIVDSGMKFIVVIFLNPMIETQA